MEVEPGLYIGDVFISHKSIGLSSFLAVLKVYSLVLRINRGGLL